MLLSGSFGLYFCLLLVRSAILFIKNVKVYSVRTYVCV